MKFLKTSYSENIKIEEKLVDQTTESNEIIIKYLKKVSVLREGTSFGEVALLLSKPRTATIKAKGPVD